MRRFHLARDPRGRRGSLIARKPPRPLASPPPAPRRPALAGLAALLALLVPGTPGRALGAGAPAIPFPDALDRAAVTVPRLEDRLEDALILGNGDLNALLYSEGGRLELRITKNDVWDARLDTTLDPPLPALARLEELAAGEWPDRQWILPEGSSWEGPDSYHAHPYPCPRACALVRLGEAPPRAWWRCIRAEGAENAWERDGEAAVMRIQGRPGASTGYACGPLDLSTDELPRLELTVSGSPNARFYADVMDPAGGVVFKTGWQESPAGPETRTFHLPPGRRAAVLILYTWTEDGKPAANRFQAVAFAGPGKRLAVDLGASLPPGPPARLDLRRAAARAVAAGGQVTEVRALSDRNVILIDSPLPASLAAIHSAGLPRPEAGEEGGVRWVRQEIPGDLDWPGMSFAVALGGAGRRKAVSVVTSGESADPVRRAVALARETAEEEEAQLVRRHESDWERFWARSGIALDDRLLEAAWYRNLYFLRCVSRPGALSPGLFAGLVDDRPAWHGDYHTNYNIQQTFWGAFAANHLELTEPYERLIRAWAPRARWLARRVFGLAGAYYPHVLFAYEPPEPESCRSPNGRQYLHHVWGFTIGVSGFTVQPLWWRYEHGPDPEYLEEVAYPAVRDVAIFYADFAARCRRDGEGRVVLAPSVSPEHWGWTPGFERNRNGTFDIAFVRWTLEAAVAGATRLERDGALAERWRRVLEELPGYPATGGEEPVVVDVEGAPPITYNIAVPAVPVFPGDQVNFWSPAAERALFGRTIERLEWNGNNSMVILAVARARLSLPGTVEWLHLEVEARRRPNGTLTLNRRGHPFNAFGHYTEELAVTAAVSELLLQGAGGTVRLFPAWPREREARFRRLRVRGGFLVSGETGPEGVGPVEVEAEGGGRLRLQSPWASARLERTAGPGEELVPGAGGIVEVETRPRERLVFRPGGGGER